MKAPYRNGLKGQQALSPGQRPGYMDMGKLALKGQKPYTRLIRERVCFCPCKALASHHFYPGRCPGLSACWPFRPFLRRVLITSETWIIIIMGQIIHIMVISFQRSKTLRCLTQIPQIPQMAAHPRPQYYAQSKSVKSVKSVVKYNFRNLN